MNKQVGNVQLMQKMNRLKVLNFVRNNPDVSRPIIAEKTGLSLASITNITTYLLDLGLLYESGVEKVGRVGRKSTFLRFCAKKYNIICVYMNQKYINITYADLEGNAIDKIKVVNDLKPEEIEDEVLENIQSLINLHDKDNLLGIGLAISGLVLGDSRFVFSSSLKWTSFDIKKTLESAFDVPVFVDNISIVKAVRYFSKKTYGNTDNMLFIDMENGIGAVQYVNGAILRSTLGEIGHTTVEHNGEPCFCGNRGCLEAMCSAKRLFSLYEKESGREIKDMVELDSLYKKDDSAAVNAIRECGEYLGIGLANLVSLFNPSLIVIDSGDFKGCSSLFIEGENELRKRAYPALTKKLYIKQINETEENILSAIAFNLCDRFFNISFQGNIID